MYATLNSELEKLVLVKPQVEKVHEIKTERPVTPIWDEVVQPAGSLGELHNLLKRRLLVTRTWALSFLSDTEQEELASILFSEVTRIWPALHSCGYISLLTDEQNRKLLRRMTIYVITTCQILFDRHIEIFQKMLKTEVFERSANFVRIRLMLADEAARLLDIAIVRRYIGDDIRAVDNGQVEQTPRTSRKDNEITFSQLVTMCRPVSQQRTKFSLEADIRILKMKLPHLDLSVLRSVLSTLPPLPPIVLSDQMGDENLGEGSQLGSTGMIQRYSTEEILKMKMSNQAERAVASLSHRRITSASDPLKYYEPEFSNVNGEVTFITQPVELDFEARKEIKRSLHKVKIVDDPDIEIQPLLKTSLYLEGPSRRKAEKEERIAQLQKIIAQLEKTRRVEVRRSPYIQPDYFDVPVEKHIIMRASGCRITERQMEATISLTSFTPLFDEITFDITETDIAQMDETLFVHRELADVYKEIVAVIPKDYLEVSSDKSVLPSASGPFDLARCMASARMSKTKRGIGSATIRRLPASTALTLAHDVSPWSKEGLKTWAKNGPSKVLCTTERNKTKVSFPMASSGIGQNLTGFLPDYMDAKLFMQWYAYWRQIVSTEDYYKYINRQDTDFLCYVYHLWGDEGGREEEARDSAIGASSGTGSPLLSASPTKRGSSRLSRQSSTRQSAAPTPVPGGDLEMWVQETTIKPPLETEAAVREKKAKMEKMMKDGARFQSLTGVTQSISLTDYAAQRLEQRREEEFKRRKLTPDEILERDLARMTIQQRFQRVWDFLRLDDDRRTQLTFKYSGSEAPRLFYLVKLWERATHAILKREYVLGQVEQFERIASDPNRFYEKGYLGSTQARLDEEVVRASLLKQLEQHDTKVKTEITRLATGTGGDVVMYRGQPYLDKMKGDRVQVLFWLSEERKAEAIKRHLADERLNEALWESTLIGPQTPSLSPRTTKRHAMQIRDTSTPLPLTAEDLLSHL